MSAKTNTTTKSRYSASFTLSPLIVGNAAAAMDTERIRGFLTAASIVPLAVMVLVLIQQPPYFWTIAVVCVSVSVVVGFLAGRLHEIQIRRLARKGIAAPRTVRPELLKCRVDVYDDHVDIDGPARQSASHKLSEIKKFWCDEETIVLQFRDSSFAVVPRTAMSNSRYLNLIDFFDKNTR